MEMENPGEVSQILSGLTFDRNNIFLMQEKLLTVLKITCMRLLSASKNIVPIESYVTFKSSKFATLPQDFPSGFSIFGLQTYKIAKAVFNFMKDSIRSEKTVLYRL